MPLPHGHHKDPNIKKVQVSRFQGWMRWGEFSVGITGIGYPLTSV